MRGSDGSSDTRFYKGSKEDRWVNSILHFICCCLVFKGNLSDLFDAVLIGDLKVILCSWDNRQAADSPLTFGVSGDFRVWYLNVRGHFDG